MVKAMCRHTTWIEEELRLDNDVGLDKTISQLAMANNVHWYGHVF